MVGGAVDSVTTYEPYGKLLARSGSSGTVYGYTGEQHDAATGLVYLRARYYNPNLKVFMSRDPFPGWPTLPASQHGYSYVHNNPVNLTDPSGEAPPLVVAAGAVVVIGGAALLIYAATRPAASLAPIAPPMPSWLPDDFYLYPGKWLYEVCTTVLTRPETEVERQAREYVDSLPSPQRRLVDALPGPQFPRPNQSSNRIIVELGAGDYSNAIAMKRAHPRDRVIATNLIEDWEAGRWFHKAGYSQNDYPQIGFYLGWVEAQKWGVEVGTPMPYENAQVPSETGDLVYTILPYPSSAEQFGRDAARIAKQQPGTIVAVTSGAGSAHNSFIRGFNQVRGRSIFIPITGAIYGEPGAGWEDGPYTTWVYQIP